MTYVSVFPQEMFMSLKMSSLPWASYFMSSIPNDTSPYTFCLISPAFPFTWKLKTMAAGLISFFSTA